MVAILGSDNSTQAGNAALSAFNRSSLVGAGWTAVVYNDAALSTFLSGGLAGAGIVMMDSAGNVSGGANFTELGYFTTNAVKINNFLGGGGGLFSQANDYGWVSALLPTLGVGPDQGAQGLALTPSGNAAFPGLTNANLSSGPWHNYFTNTAGLPILAASTTFTTTAFPNGAPVVIGASGGSVTNPNPPGNVPDGGSFALVYLGLGGLLFFARRWKMKSAA